MGSFPSVSSWMGAKAFAWMALPQSTLSFAFGDGLGMAARLGAEGASCFASNDGACSASNLTESPGNLSDNACNSAARRSEASGISARNNTVSCRLSRLSLTDSMALKLESMPASNGAPGADLSSMFP